MNSDPLPAIPAPENPPRIAGRWTWHDFWPPAAVIGLLLAALGVCIRLVSRNNGGHLIYPLDDVYLHFAIAKNLIHHGTWGYSALNGFSSGDSSLLYPVLAAAWMAVSGAGESTGLILNVAAVTGAMFYAAGMLRRGGFSGWRSFLILAGTLFLAALPMVVATGMEHGVQILIDLVFVDLAIRLLTETPGTPLPTARNARFLVLGSLVTSIRFEGMFLIGVVGLLLLIRRRWTLAVLLGVFAATPLVLFGLYSVSKGWYPLPNSVLIKGNTKLILTPLGIAHYFRKSVDALHDNPHMIVLILAMSVVLAVQLRRRRTLWTPRTLLLTITLAVTLIHIQFAALGWLYRYEAYLMVLGLLVVGAWLTREIFPEEGRRRQGGAPGARRYAVGVGVVALLLCLPLLRRAKQSLWLVPIASHNIYEQQYQMALFLRQFYQGKGVAANDIGFINYLADIRFVDLVGLGDIDVLRARRKGAFDHTTVQGLTDRYGVRLILAYARAIEEFGGQLPDYTLVGEWTIFDDQVCAAPTVQFYAPNDALVPEVTNALQAFAPRLPSSVAQSGLYCGGRPPHAQGYLGQVKDQGAPFYETNYSVAFDLYPRDEPAAATPENATLQLDVQPMGRDLSVDVFVNGERVETKDFSGAPPAPAWTPWMLGIKWRAGLNTLRVIGHGTPVASPRYDHKILFNLREPRWAPAPAATPPPA